MAAKDNFFYPKKTLKIRGKVIRLDKALVMGVINLTPDSFYSGSRYTKEKGILSQVEKIVGEGVDFIDFGAYSSRPRAEDISFDEELKRLMNALPIIKKEFPDTYISIDTFRSGIADAAISEGADMINDISGGQADSDMFETITRNKVPYVLMHMKGTPQNMHTLTQYEDLLLEMVKFFETQVSRLYELGHNDIVIDPGIGFAKTIAQNYEILKNLDYFNVLKLPLLIGVSRKSFIYKRLNISPEESLNGTTVINTVAALKGASILRVHDVKEAKEVVELINYLSH